MENEASAKAESRAPTNWKLGTFFLPLLSLSSPNGKQTQKHEHPSLPQFQQTEGPQPDRPSPCQLCSSETSNPAPRNGICLKASQASSSQHDCPLRRPHLVVRAVRHVDWGNAAATSPFSSSSPFALNLEMELSHVTFTCHCPD